MRLRSISRVLVARIQSEVVTGGLATMDVLIETALE